MTVHQTDTGTWLRRFHPAPESSCRLICLPHAGGSAVSYFSISAAMCPTAEVLAVQYPGRHDRRREPCFASLAELADELCAVVRSVDPPLALFGHSLGAVAAFELARRLERDAGVSPVGLFVSGRRAPSLIRAEHVHRRDDDGLVAELRSLGGIDTRILDDPEVLRMVLPAIRSDYQAIETYEYRPGPPLTCPVTALVGTEDPRAPVDEVQQWQRETVGPFRLVTFPGGHFYLDAQQERVVEAIRGQLAETSRR